MAVTLTIPELLSALRMGDTPEETAEAQRLLVFTTQAISDYLGSAYEGTPASVVNEAAIRLSGHLFDQPYASRGTGFAASLANSGAGAILLPYRIHRAGSVAEAAALAVQSGTVGNPVVQISIVGNDLVVEYADASTADVPLPAAISQGNAVVGLSLSGTTLTILHEDGSEEEITLPAGGGSGVDQTARDSASNAQTDADAARDDAAAAQGTADGAATAADAAAATANANTGRADGAQAAAAAAQDRADDAFALADGKVDSSGATSAAREVTSDWAEAENIDPIPAPKLVNVVSAHEDIVHVLDGRLPGLPVAMRLGWSQREEFIAADFARPSPPIGGSIAGMSDRLAAPPFPPGLASDPTLFFGIWLAGDPDIVEIEGGAQFGNKLPLTLDDGKVGGNPGVYRVSTARLSPIEGTIFSVTITGPRLVLEAELFAHESDPDAHHVPPAGMGGGPGEDATARAAAATAQTDADLAQAAADVNTATLAGLAPIPSVPPVYQTGNTDRFPTAKVTDATADEYLAISNQGNIIGVTSPIPAWLADPLGQDIPFALLDDVLEPWTAKVNSDVIPDPRLPIERFVPSAAGATDGQVAKVLSGAWVVGDEEGGGPGGSDLEVSTADIQFLRSTTLVEIDSQGFTSGAWSNLQRDGADVVCPTTGHLEFFMHAKTGGRDNSVAFAKIPASELRATPTDGEMQVALGANRWFGIRTNSLADQNIQLKGQDGQTSVDGNYSVRMSHIEEVTATVVTGVTSGGGGA